MFIYVKNGDIQKLDFWLMSQFLNASQIFFFPVNYETQSAFLVFLTATLLQKQPTGNNPNVYQQNIVVRSYSTRGQQTVAPGTDCPVCK